MTETYTCLLGIVGSVTCWCTTERSVATSAQDGSVVDSVSFWRHVSIYFQIILATSWRLMIPDLSVS